MLASLRPHSPSVFGIKRHYQHPSVIQPAHSDNAKQSQAAPMEGRGAPRYTPPPLVRPALVADVGQDTIEPRPSPQLRQRSWHHPYMQINRGSLGPSPPASLEPGVGPSRAYERSSYDGPMADPRHRSPPHRPEHLHAAPVSRPRAGSRADLPGHAQPLNIGPRPAYPPGVERAGGIGPNRNRGRSNTLTLPHPDAARVRGNSFIAGRRHSPSNGPYSGYDEPVPPPRSWEEVRSYRDMFPHQQARDMAERRSPAPRPSSRQSSMLFAPLSPNHDAHLQLPASRVSGQMAAKLNGNPSVMTRGAQYHSRPGTPVSPLNMDNLTMEDTHLPSASGMAAPLSTGQQRSPADARARSDYFGPASTDWSRSSHGATDKAGSPRFGPYTSAPRQDPRDHPYRAPGMLPNEGVSPDTEMPRYHSAAYAATGQQPPLQHPGRAAVGAPSGFHPEMSRAEQIERERFAMAQHRGSFQAAFPGHGGPQEFGYQSEFAPQQGRMGPGGGFVGNPAQHAVPVDRIAHSRRRRRPPYSYSSMITQAISSSAEGRMTLREIYTWISTNFTGYPMSGPDSQGWQNTVRHNLSLGKIFIKKARTAQDIYDSCSSGNPSQSQAARGKGGWWTLHPVVLSQIRSGQRTHNDEFDDLERLVEIENAAASSRAASVSTLMGNTTSTSSADDTTVSRRLSADADQHKALSRQRSYSDSLRPDSVDQHRPTSSQHSSTAPVSRQGSIGMNRNAPAGRLAYPTPHGVQPVKHEEGNSVASREDMPSVLQRRSGFDGDGHLSAYTRTRGHTIAVHGSPSHQYVSRQDAGNMKTESYASIARPMTGVDPSPRYSMIQARQQVVEDVDMEPSMPPHRDSSLVLQEARETLVSAKQQQQQPRLHMRREVEGAAEAASSADTPDGAARMAIRGLLNS
ncbi:hypothetical protein EX895_003716 [Sporisorium graminicola]|uniref:Fork-head domain-containing protein n=1 Tax=Sporisorium graminicola TaxID=280036 RepID=A0A4V6ETL1_9BASI|nr:hypothetical protein EX895_003716 [Sporisorium graminicola]TKY87039.1 hypothetical protein EX895_003716 [Sporisorium graminicola]